MTARNPKILKEYDKKIYLNHYDQGN